MPTNTNTISEWVKKWSNWRWEIQFWVQNSHWKFTLHYKKTRPDLGEEILYKYGSEMSELKTYCNADYGCDTETYNSTTGYLLILAEVPVAWCSSRQLMVTMSFTEA